MDWDHLHRRLLETLEALTSPEEARAEARLWLEDGFKRDQAWLTLHGEDPVNRDDQQRFHTWLERRKEESLVSICGVGPCFAIDRSGAIPVF